MNECQEFVDGELQSGVNKPGVSETKLDGWVSISLTDSIKTFYVCYSQETSADVRSGS